MKIAVSGERLGRALPSTLNISINYFRPVSVNLTARGAWMEDYSSDEKSKPEKQIYIYMCMY